MRIAHLADLHVGFRQYDRSTRAGANQREVDVLEALRRALDGVIAANPDAVLLAGDIFHSIRPPNMAILQAFAQFQRLRASLPEADIVMIGGDHDTTRSVDAGSSILGLFRALGAVVVERGIKRVELRKDGITVLCVPKVSTAAYRAWRTSASGEPTAEPGVDREEIRQAADVLLLHGEARNVPGAPLDADFLDAGGWKYVALGHYHVAARVAPRAWYAGSLDYVSSDPWDELREQARLGLPGKGWLLVELGGDGGEPQVAFQPVEPPRRFADLLVLDAEGLAAAEIDAELEARATGIEDAVVRQVVTNLSRETARALDHAAIRARKARALIYHMDARRPPREAATVEARGLRMRRLDEIVDEFLGARALPPDLDRDEFRRLGQQYLAAATTAEDPYTGEKVGGSGQT